MQTVGVSTYILVRNALADSRQCLLGEVLKHGIR